MCGIGTRTGAMEFASIIRLLEVGPGHSCSRQETRIRSTAENVAVPDARVRRRVVSILITAGPI
jgi:hypothetical protein